MNRIIITGGSGFIGSNLLRYYHNKGWNVINIDSVAPKDQDYTRNWIDVDILDFERLKQEMIKFSPDFIIHLASRTDLDGKNLDAYAANTTGTDNIIKVAYQLPQLKRVIFTSSMLVCRTGYIPSHSTDYAPSTYYGESKVKMEEIIRRAKPDYEWAIIRPTSIWGPGFGVPYRDFFDMVMKKRYFHIGNSSCTKTYGYIGNTVYQIDCLLKSPNEVFNSEVFYLGDYQPTNIEEWANEIAEEINISILTIPFPVIKCAAFFGDILKKAGFSFPMTSFRLKNMTTNNIVDLSNMKEIAPVLPYTRIQGIKETISWLEKINRK